MQKAVLLGTTKILQKVLKYYGEQKKINKNKIELGL